MGRDYEDVVTKQLKYTPKRKVGEGNQDWTDATNFYKNLTHLKFNKLKKKKKKKKRNEIKTQCKI